MFVNDKDYIIDVGNGRFFGDPIPISDGAITIAKGFSHQIRPFDSKHLALFCRDDHNCPDTWKPRYVFLKEPVTRESFAEACHYTESSPEPIFTQSIIVTLLTEEGLIRLSDSSKGKTLKVFSPESKQGIQQLTANQFDELLRSHFKLEPVNFRPEKCLENTV